MHARPLRNSLPRRDCPSARNFVLQDQHLTDPQCTESRFEGFQSEISMPDFQLAACDKRIAGQDDPRRKNERKFLAP